MPYKIARYGWVRDLPDQRDHLYAAAPATLTALPSQTDLRPQCPPVYDQARSVAAPPTPSRERMSSSNRKRNWVRHRPSGLHGSSSTTTSVLWRAPSTQTAAPRSAKALRASRSKESAAKTRRGHTMAIPFLRTTS